MKHYYNVKNYARTPEIQELPSLIDIQLKSFEDFLNGGKPLEFPEEKNFITEGKILELFDEINPIQSFNSNLSLYFPGNHPQAQEFGLRPYLERPKYDEEECIERDMSYAAPLYVEVALVNHGEGDEIIRQDIFMGEFPLMTEKGTFIINGTERVVVSQLIRSPGVYFDVDEERATGRSLSNAKLIPDRGAWMEFETRKTDYITIKFNRKRTIPVTVLLRALAAVDDGLPKKLSPIKTGDDDEIRQLFAEVDKSETHRYIESCFKNEPSWDLNPKKKQTIAQVALIEFYRRMRPGDPPTLDNAREYLHGQLFDQRRYDLERVGRYKLNQRLGLADTIDLSHRTITKADIVKLVEQMILINNGARTKDDIDHLGNRRVKTVGELIGNKLRIGLRRMERVVKERMSIREAEQLTPVSLVNIRPIVAAVREFFGSSQLSQFMEQTNPLSELTHKRTLSALGPGGLRRERAGFDVRDVHHSHYGRICPIETPEGPNIGLIGRLASYARVNELGFIETPYRKVVSALDVDDPDVLGRVVGDDVEAELRIERDAIIDEMMLERLRLFGSDVGDLPVLSNNDEIFAAVAQIAELGSSDALDETQRVFDEFAEKVSGDYARLDQAVFAMRSKSAPFNEEAVSDFLSRFEPRMNEIAQAYDGYDDARAEVWGAVTQLRMSGELPEELAADAERFEDKMGGHGEEREDLEKGLRNLNSALIEVAKLNGGDIPKNLRDRISRWGKKLTNYPDRIAKVRSDQAGANEALGNLVKANLQGEEVIHERPVADDLIGQRIGRSVRIETLVLDEGEIIDQGALDLLEKYGIREVPVTPFATDDITYLSADNEDRFIIAQANARLDEKGQFLSNRVSARYDQGFLSVPPQRIDYMDIAPRQIVGISAALIPFLSHDAANRALMGSNMQRQAVPLITPDVSVVSTGMESQAAFDSGQVLVSEIEAEVVSVQGHRVIVRTETGEEKTFQLRKYERSNQSTCIDQRPLVRKGDMIKPGDVIADSSSTYNGQLALGHDVLTCFLSWDGGNYEDALLVSEDMLRADKFTSIHIEKHEIEARDTKLGAEEITYDIPNVGEEALKDLDEHGIVRIGAEVGPNDILVGKITPKGEKELSPEEKLLRAIFGEQAREVKDSSLRLPHGDRGKVIDVKVFTRDEHPDLSAGVEKMVRVSVAQRRKLTVGDKMAGRHGNKGVISKIVTVEDMPYIEGGVPVEIILNPLGVPSRMNIGQILELHLGWAADRLGFRAITPVFDGVQEQEIQAELGRAWLIDWAWKLTTERAWENHLRLAESAGIAPEDFEDDMHVYQSYLVDLVGVSLIDEVAELVQDLEDRAEEIVRTRVRNHLRRVAVAETLREYGYDPGAVMVYDNSQLTIEERDTRDANAVLASIRLWIQQHALEALELPDDLTTRELFEIANRVMFETKIPVPHYGKQTLYDGRTGEPFDRDVAVGYVHMLKLAHLVEDKAHARSTGPYSLVTQQPLGGKAQFGGQRFGEMEVWALEAYGAANILQEMLTVKSDDVQGRVKTYESIVKGEPIEEPGIPTSFRVLVKELQSLGLSVEAITGAGDVIRFGKYDEQARRPQPETGLLGLGTS